MKRWLIALVVLAVVGAAGAVYVRSLMRSRAQLEVTSDEIRTRDLDALVSASGKIQPKRQVNVSATTMGRVTRLAVKEGERVRAGQFLLEIDPRSLAGQIERGQAGVAAARSSFEQSQTAVEQAQATLELAQQTLQRQQQLSRDGLTTREALERAQSDVALRLADVRARQQDVQTRQQQVRQEQATLSTTRYNLSQVTINSPMDGLVTRRNIEEGENVVVGTMNNAGTVLLTVADMSVVQAEIEVDETDVPTVALGQPARVTIDAVPGKIFQGHVTEIGNSPIQQTSTGTTGQAQATTFKVVVTINEQVPELRPGFTCTAEIVTATRKGVVAVPIQAVTVRDLIFDAAGAIVRQAPPERRGSLFGGAADPATTAATAAATVEPGPDQTRRETEGVFVLRDGRALFTPVRVGIAGERYFEVLSGLVAGDRVITGPFSSVRQLADGELVRTAQTGARP